MIDKQQELSILLTQHLLKNSTYLEAINIIKRNSRGKVWLIGSGVYKTLLNLFYNYNYTIKDWDFIVEKINKPIELDTDWTIGQTKHGNLKLQRSDLIIDFIILNNIHSIHQRNLKPTINNYLSGSPLTIQSIAFDIDNNLVIGKIGINSLLNKTVGINNNDEYKYAKNIYGDNYSVEYYANLLGFKKI